MQLNHKTLFVMKQVIFSFPDQKIPVINLIYGDMTDDGFKPITDRRVLSNSYNQIFGDRIFPYIHFDKYFNNTPFIDAENFNAFFNAIIDKVDSFSYYPNLFVCTLKSDHDGTQEKAS